MCKRCERSLRHRYEYNNKTKQKKPRACGLQRLRRRRCGQKRRNEFGHVAFCCGASLRCRRSSYARAHAKRVRSDERAKRHATRRGRRQANKTKINRRSPAHTNPAPKARAINNRFRQRAFKSHACNSLQTPIARKSQSFCSTMTATRKNAVADSFLMIKNKRRSLCVAFLYSRLKNMGGPTHENRENWRAGGRRACERRQCDENDEQKEFCIFLFYAQCAGHRPPLAGRARTITSL